METVNKCRHKPPIRDTCCTAKGEKQLTSSEALHDDGGILDEVCEEIPWVQHQLWWCEVFIRRIAFGLEETATWRP